MKLTVLHSQYNQEMGSLTWWGPQTLQKKQIFNVLQMTSRVVANLILREVMFQNARAMAENVFFLGPTVLQMGPRTCQSFWM